MHTRHLLVAAMATVFACNAATAAKIERTEITMAVAACQSALPVFDGVIRKRPLAVQNEGTSPSFLTCGLEGVYFSQPHSLVVQIMLANTGSEEATANCTLVDAGANFAAPTYFPQSRSIMPGLTGHFTWYPEDPKGFIYPAISCSLAPGTGINYVARSFTEEIGD